MSSSVQPAISAPIRIPVDLRPVRNVPAPIQVPRSMMHFRAAGPEALSVRGAAPKWIVHRENDSSDFFVVKGASSFGETETYTEFFLNQLGYRLGFRMAASGLMYVDGVLHFASRSFLDSGESLVHGSVIAQQFWEEKEIQKIGRKGEQNFFTIDLLIEMLEKFCDRECGHIVDAFIDMIVFDAGIGSMDRHMQNWGVITTTQLPLRMRFAPIFDTARALLWNQEEAALERLASDSQSLKAYVNRSKPCIGIAGARKTVSHFGLVKELLKLRRKRTILALRRLGLTDRLNQSTTAAPKLCWIATNLLGDYPFCKVFSPKRKSLILKVLAARCDALASTLSEGGAR